MIGTRLPDRHHDGNFPDGMCDGCYWRSLDDGTWHIVTPNGLHGWLRNHMVLLSPDGTITVPLTWLSSANSILVSGGADGLSWHGSIERGEWVSC